MVLVLEVSMLWAVLMQEAVVREMLRCSGLLARHSRGQHAPGKS